MATFIREHKDESLKESRVLLLSSLPCFRPEEKKWAIGTGAFFFHLSQSFHEKAIKCVLISEWGLFLICDPDQSVG